MNNLNFSDLSLSQEVQQAIAEMGFNQATPIQSQAIPILLEGKDVIGQAQTGTGKTAAFAIPALEQCQSNIYKPQTLVLCPTRELANQVAEEFKKLGKYLKGIHVTAVYGGESIDRQIKALKRGTQIVIGTPGRIIDHIERGTLELSHIQQIILDEADEMLNMGFIEDIERVLALLPEERQTVFFSATMPQPILDLTRRFQKNPQLVKVTTKQLTNTTIEQLYFTVKSEYKTELLQRLIEIYELKSMVVFCNTKQKVDELVAELQQNGQMAEALHGDLRQMQRNVVMGKFKTGVLPILVATDVAARGIDVENVEAVINYDTPLDAEYYVHRIGRTGRAGKSGKSFTFVTPRDVRKVKEIERYSNITIPQGKIPSRADVWQKRQAKMGDKIKQEIAEGGLNHFQNLIEQLTNEGLNQQEIIAALLKMQLGVPQLQNQIDISATEKARDFKSDKKFDKKSKPSRAERKGSNKMVRLFMNLGKNQKISKGDILGAITGETGIKGFNIGSIDIYDKYSFIDVAQIEAQTVLRVMNKSTIKGKKVNFEFAEN
jgi:ATP-dependent RNA helicase DeaD